MWRRCHIKHYCCAFGLLQYFFINTIYIIVCFQQKMHHQQHSKNYSAHWQCKSLKHHGGREWDEIKCEPSQVYQPRQAYQRDCLSSRLSFTVVGLCFGLWGSLGTNAVSHHPPGSQLPITVLLFLTDQPVNPSQQATVKIQTHLDNAVTYPVKCLSCPLCRSVCSLSFSLQSICLISHTYTTYKHRFLFLLSFIRLFHTLCCTSLDRSHLCYHSISVITFLLTYHNFLFFPPFSLSSCPFPFLLPHLILQAKTSWGRLLSSCTPTGQTGTMVTCEGRHC